MKDTLVINGTPIARFTVEGPLGDLVKDFDLSFEVETEDELRLVAAALGGIERLDGDDRLLSYRPEGAPYASPRTEGGRTVDVHVWLAPELAAKPTPDPPTVLKRLRDEAALERARDAADDAAAAIEQGEPHVDNEGYDVHDAGGPTEPVRP